VHHATVAPMPNATRRSQAMYFEYKNVTGFRGPGGFPLDP